MKINNSWYVGSLVDRTLFNYLRKKGWNEQRIMKLATRWVIAGITIAIIGAIVLFGPGW
ncbi:MAG: hypothetical protein IMZ52_07775 [Actinobacteria bacterium]|nr:hypothetical protein [Actinomycetota bacterium]